MKYDDSKTTDKTPGTHTGAGAHGRRHAILILMLLVALFFGFLRDAAATGGMRTISGGIRTIRGLIGTRGAVLGDNDKPVWVEYDEEGEVARVIGEAVEELENARAVSAKAYLAYFESEGFVPDPRVGEDTESVLVGPSWEVLEASGNNIGYLVAFYTPAGEDPLSTAEGRNSMYGCERGDTLWAPVDGAGIGAFAGLGGSVSKDGVFSHSHFVPSCVGTAYTYPHHLYAGLRYSQFNPRRKFPAVYYVRHRLYDHCTGISENMHVWSLQTAAARMGSTAVEAPIEASQRLRDKNVSADLAMLAGEAVLANERRAVGEGEDDAFAIGLDPQAEGIVPLGPTTYLYEKPEFQETILYNLDTNGDGVYDAFDLDGDGDEDTAILAPENPDDPDSKNVVKIWLDTSDPDKDPPDCVRLPDTFPDFFDRGLLTSIGAEDLNTTDMLVYRLSNERLIAGRTGLHPCEISNDSESLINYRFLFRGPASFIDPAAEDLVDFQSNTLVDPELYGARADRVRAGEKLGVVLINRATGYIGKAVAAFPEKVQGANVSVHAGRIAMRPPNLEIEAKRQYKVGQGLSKDETRNYIVGFEGAGLETDEYIKITTRWYGWDGSPLPSDLDFPGYTARIAKIDKPKGEEPADRLFNKISEFPIMPGTRTQFVALSGTDLRKAHFYIHVSGNPEKWDPFSSADPAVGPGEAPLEERPIHYVPIKVPIYDEVATNNARLKNSNAQAVYRWVYRPEMQFSVFDLDRMMQIAPDGGETDLLADPPEDGDKKTVLDSFDYQYSLYEEYFAALDDLGPERGLLLSIGGEEAAAETGSDRTASFDPERIPGSMTSEGVLALRLSLNRDAGNVLWEYASAIFHAPPRSYELTRSYQAARFDPPVTNPPWLDEYRIAEVFMFEEADLEVNILDMDGNKVGDVVGKTRLSRGWHSFVVDYATVLSAAGIDEGSRFKVELRAESEGWPHPQSQRFDGLLDVHRQGRKTGMVVEHGVTLDDGALNLTREDFSVEKSCGPRLRFVRSYNSQINRKGIQAMGEGWSHNHEKKIVLYVASEIDDMPMPPWIRERVGTFFDSMEAPVLEWNFAIVNATCFRRAGGAWHAERGRHGELTEEREGDNSFFVYKAKDGTKYRYVNPPCPWTPDEHGERAFDLMGGHGMDKVREVVDRNGKTLTYAYNADDFVESVVDAVGREIGFNYVLVENGYNPLRNELEPWFEPRLESVEGPDGIVVSFAYDGPTGVLETATRAHRTETYEYIEEPYPLPRFNLVSADKNGHVFEYEYLETENVLELGVHPWEVVGSVRYPGGCSASLQYPSKNIRNTADLNGNSIKYTLDDRGRALTVSGPGEKTVSMSWDGDSNMVSRTDGNGNTTTYSYDGKGNVVAENRPIGSVATEWNEFCLPVSRTDANGVTLTWRYDVNGNPVSHTDGDGYVHSYENDGCGNRISETGPGGTTLFGRDGRGYLASRTEPEGSVARYSHDVVGHLTSETDPDGNTTSYGYDALGYPKGVTLPANPDAEQPYSNVLDVAHDVFGNKVSDSDRNGVSYSYSYTARNQVSSITRSTGGTRSFGYDCNGNMVSETDWKGQTTSHAYNALNFRTSTTNRNGDSMAMTCDPEGNMLSSTDFESAATTMTYDSLNRMTQKTTHGEGETAWSRSYTYYLEKDPETNLKTATDPEGNETTYAWNGRYLKTSRTDALGNAFAWEYDGRGNVEKETDEEGNSTLYVHDGQDRLTSLTRADGGREEYSYDPNGNRTTATDARGNTTSFQYDSWNRRISAADPDGYSVSARYDGEGNKTSETDGNGVSRTWSRDGNGNATEYTDGEGFKTTHDYDLNGNRVKTVNPRGLETVNAYDAEDRLVGVSQTGGDLSRSRSIDRDRTGHPVRETDWKGNATLTAYNAVYLPVSVTDPEGNKTKTDYYLTGQVKSVTDRRGNTTEYEIDALGRVVRVVDPLEYTVETAYDKVGNVVSVTDKRGIVSTTSYDPVYRPVTRKRAGATTGTYVYDPNGNPTSFTDAKGYATSCEYNGRNLRTVTAFPDSTTVAKAYDGVGNVVNFADEEGKETVYVHDGENRVVSTVFAGETTTMEYDCAGNPTKIVRPKGTKKKIAYDALGRLVSLTEVLKEEVSGEETGLVTTYAYDENDNMTAVTLPQPETDALSHGSPDGNTGCERAGLFATCAWAGNAPILPDSATVALSYDSLDRNIRREKAGLFSTYAYDPEGNLVSETEGDLFSETDPDGRTATYSYDALNRRTGENYETVGGIWVETSNIGAEYDANGNVVKITETKTGGVVDIAENVYDDFDRKTRSVQRGVAVEYSYDANGNRTGVSSPNGSTVYAYDSRNRLVGAGSDETDETVFTYTPDGKKASVSRPNGTVTNYAYWPNDRIKSVEHKYGDTTVSSYACEYDADGNRASQTEFRNGETEITTYSYDPAGRLAGYVLKDEAEIAAGLPGKVVSYTYEGYNRKTETVEDDGATVSDKTFVYDYADRLVETYDYGNDSTISYEYDNYGNTVRKTEGSLTTTETSRETIYLYDARDRMVEAVLDEEGSETVLGRYDYDHAGLRIRHRDSERGDVDCYYDETAVLEERDASDDSLLARYAYAGLLLSIDTGEGMQYYHHDPLGSVVDLTDALGTVRVSYKLDPWGRIRERQGETVNRMVFTGQEHDEQTGLVYFGARYYDPDTARFTTQDPYLGDPGTPPSLHRYLYAYSNPLVFIDLLGYAAAYGGSESVDFVSALPYNANVHYEQNEFVKKVANARGIEIYQALNFLKDQYEEWGINEKNAFSSAVVLLEKNDGSKEGIKKALEYLGGRFNDIYGGNPVLQKEMQDAFENAKAGDLVNISRFWSIAVGEMTRKAADFPGKGNYSLQRLVNGESLDKKQQGSAARQLVQTVGSFDFRKTSGAPQSELDYFEDKNLTNQMTALAIVAGFTDLPVIGMGRSGFYKPRFSDDVVNQVWALGPAPRGEAIEAAWGHNLPQKFKTWDHFEKGVATSYKSIDIRLPGYSKSGSIWNYGKRAVDAAIDFDNYYLKGVRIDSSMIGTRSVRIAVPKRPNATQFNELKRIIQYGEDNKIKVTWEIF